MNPYGNRYIPILCYHRVCPENERGSDSPSLCVSPEQFRRQMSLLKWLGYRTVSLQDFVAYSEARKNLDGKCVALTFDDGYEDNFTYAFPILKEFSFIATIFLVTERIGQKNIWDSGTVPLLNESQIEEMGFNGIYFGSHTATHIDMTQKSPDEIKKELEGSKKELERLTSRMDAPFCYPYARTNEQAQKLVRSAGFLCGVSGDMGSNGQSQNCFDLMRIQVFPSNELFAFWKKLQPWYPRWMEIQKRIKD